MSNFECPHCGSTDIKQLDLNMLGCVNCLCVFGVPIEPYREYSERSIGAMIIVGIPLAMLGFVLLLALGALVAGL